MTHEMKLNPRPFSLMAEGKKTIELRLYDEKRQKIQIGDTLAFSNTEAPEQSIVTTVVALHRFPDFEALYRELPLEKCGYATEEIATASPQDMEEYYTKQEQMRYGVVGIELVVKVSP